MNPTNQEQPEITSDVRRPWARMIVEITTRVITLAKTRAGFARTEDILVHRWATLEVRERQDLSIQTDAADDPLEAIAPLLTKALANDPPALRRRVQAAIASTHLNIKTAALAARP